jgi:hypothetical protein
VHLHAKTCTSTWTSNVNVHMHESALVLRAVRKPSRCERQGKSIAAGQTRSSKCTWTFTFDVHVDVHV